MATLAPPLRPPRRLAGFRTVVDRAPAVRDSTSEAGGRRGAGGLFAAALLPLRVLALKALLLRFIRGPGDARRPVPDLLQGPPGQQSHDDQQDEGCGPSRHERQRVRDDLSVVLE